MAGNTADSETAFSVHHACVVIGGYAGNLAGVMPSQVPVKFPTTRSTSLFDGTNLHILQLDRWDWDVIHHEFGHYFMAIHGFQDNPGGRHGFGDNLTVTRGSKDIGVRLAWGERLAYLLRHLGTERHRLQRPDDSPPSGTRGTRTPKTRRQISIWSLRTVLGKTMRCPFLRLFGISSTPRATALTRSTSAIEPSSISSMPRIRRQSVAPGKPLAGPRSTRERALLGGILAQANISPELTSPAENFTIMGTAPPTFRWLKNGGGTPNPLNEFVIRFYDNDFANLIFEKNLGDTDSYTPNAAELTTILSMGSPIKWIVEGKDTRTPETPGGTLGRYWSQARTLGGVDIGLVIDDTGSMGEEIAGVRDALQDFIDEVDMRLGPDDIPPTIQLITFKDDVTSRIISNDLDAVRAAVAALTASGGGDCPEFSAQALQLAAANISNGGTILLATDASSQPGVDMGAVTASLRAKGVTLNTILSGDCSGLSESVNHSTDPELQLGSAQAWRR